MRTITPTLHAVPVLTLPPDRPRRPSEREVAEALHFFTGLRAPFGPDTILLANDLRAMSEQAIWQMRRLAAGEIPSLALPTRLPRIDEFYSREWGCPWYLVEDRRRHVFD